MCCKGNFFINIMCNKFLCVLVRYTIMLVYSKAHKGSSVPKTGTFDKYVNTRVLVQVHQ